MAADGAEETAAAWATTAALVSGGIHGANTARLNAA